jgi:hypothetical protein
MFPHLAYAYHLVTNIPKRVIRSRKSNDRQYNNQTEKDKQRSTKTLNRKLKIEQHKHHYKPGVNSGTPEKSHWNVASYKWNIHNGKIEIILFVL